MRSGKAAISALVAISITLGYLWFANRSIAPKEATWEDVVAEAATGGYRLISTEEVWQKYQKDPESLLLVDTRQPWEYRSGHIKGALNYPMEPTWWARWRARGPLAAFLGSDENRFLVFQ
jgi:hypothetical protein